MINSLLLPWTEQSGPAQEPSHLQSPFKQVPFPLHSGVPPHLG